jgi:hypothetical protein
LHRAERTGTQNGKAQACQAVALAAESYGEYMTTANTQAILVATGVVLLCGSISVAYGLQTGFWVRGLFFGLVLPGVVLVDWLRLRAQGREVGAVRLFVSFVIAVASLTWMMIELIRSGL